MIMDSRGLVGFLRIILGEQDWDDDSPLKEAPARSECGDKEKDHNGRTTGPALIKGKVAYVEDVEDGDIILLFHKGLFAGDGKCGDKLLTQPEFGLQPSPLQADDRVSTALEVPVCFEESEQCALGLVHLFPGVVQPSFREGGLGASPSVTLLLDKGLQQPLGSLDDLLREFGGLGLRTNRNDLGFQVAGSSEYLSKGPNGSIHIWLIQVVI